MANLNKVMLIGRLTRDPDAPRTFASGGKVIQFSFAVTNRKKNQQTGQWEDDPMFIDCKVFGRADNTRQVDLVQQYLHKGRQVFLEGHLVFDRWDDKQTGQKRSKHVLHVDHFEFLDSIKQEGSDGGGSYQGRPPADAPADSGPPPEDYSEPPMSPPAGKEASDDIPF